MRLYGCVISRFFSYVIPRLDRGIYENENMSKQFYVYILTNKRNGTLYIGVTSNLVQRIWQHRESLADGFTKKYSLKHLVYYEKHESAESAIHREKRLKEWKREWKLALIEKLNPSWDDLYKSILG